MSAHYAILEARAAAEHRERVRRTPEWKKPPVKLHRVRVRPSGRSFFYTDRFGAMHPAGPGDVLTVDSELLEMRRRDLELLD